MLKKKKKGSGIHKGLCVHNDYLASEEEFLVQGCLSVSY